MKNHKASPKPKPKNRPIAAPPKPRGYSYERTTLGNHVYNERIPPRRNVPGTGAAKWDRLIGQWVAGFVKSDGQRIAEQDARVW